MLKDLFIGIIISFITFLSVFGQNPHNIELYHYKVKDTITYNSNIDSLYNYINFIRSDVNYWLKKETTIKKINNVKSYNIKDSISFKEFDDFSLYDRKNLFAFKHNKKLSDEAQKRARIISITLDYDVNNLYLYKSNGKSGHIFETKDMQESIGYYQTTNNQRTDMFLCNETINNLIIDSPKCLGHRKHLLSDDMNYKHIGIGYHSVNRTDGQKIVVVVILTSTDSGLDYNDNFNMKMNNGQFYKF